MHVQHKVDDAGFSTVAVRVVCQGRQLVSPAYIKRSVNVVTNKFAYVISSVDFKIKISKCLWN